MTGPDTFVIGYIPERVTRHVRHYAWLTVVLILGCGCSLAANLIRGDWLAASAYVGALASLCAALILIRSLARTSYLMGRSDGIWTALGVQPD